MIDTFSAEDVLKSKGYFSKTVVGISMQPLLKGRRDSVIVENITAPLKKYDVVLFRRGEKLVLHRIVKIKKDYYIIRGDNCIQNEVVYENQILGIMTTFVRNGKQCSVNDRLYRLYSVVCPMFYAFNFLRIKAKYILWKIYRRLNEKV